MGSFRDRTRSPAPVLIATVVFVMLHLLDDAVWHTPRGAAVGHGLLLAAPLFALLVAWAVVTALAPPPSAVALSFVVAALLAVDAALHLAHASDSGVGGSDVTGL